MTDKEPKNQDEVDEIVEAGDTPEPVARPSRAAAPDRVLDDGRKGTHVTVLIDKNGKLKK